MSGAHVTVPGATEGAQEGNGHVEDSESLLAGLRQAAAAQQEEHYEDFKVGGEFKNRLWIRYRPLGPEQMDRFINRRAAARENPQLDIPITELNMDLMAQACLGVYGSDDKGENKFPLRDEQGAIRLEHRLVAFLGMPVPPGSELLTAREVVMMLFGQNAMAVVTHGDALVEWMQDPASYVRPGESSGVSG